MEEISFWCRGSGGNHEPQQTRTPPPPATGGIARCTGCASRCAAALPDARQLDQGEKNPVTDARLVSMSGFAIVIINKFYIVGHFLTRRKFPELMSCIASQNQRPYCPLAVTEAASDTGSNRSLAIERHMETRQRSHKGGLALSQVNPQAEHRTLNIHPVSNRAIYICTTSCCCIPVPIKLSVRKLNGRCRCQTHPLI
ncbi:hypothetical protein J6590_004822 [Homalodisca vitripennis]|nr:hypothetical protein J6590_004822 [Homalodisca vitripennis]